MPTDTPPRGRRPKDPANRRSIVVQVRLSPIERAQIEANASEAGMGLTTFLRERGILRSVAVPEPAKPAVVTRLAVQEHPADFDRRVKEVERQEFSYLPKATARHRATRKVEAELAAG